MTVRIPVATYRLQLNKSFTFRDATALVPYFEAMGVTDVYASPFLAARAGTTHGYDVVDHTRINPEIGTDEELEALSDALRGRSMGLLMDVVPNHMCIATSANPWWNDVLENGPSSPFARFFDIDWRPPKTELAEKVLLPVLGDQYGRVLENQEISIRYQNGAFFTSYYELHLPLGPRTIGPILEPIVGDLRRLWGESHPDLLELESILTALRHLPTRSETEPEKVRERQREKEIVKKRIAALLETSEAVRRGLDRSLKMLNGRRGSPHTFDEIERLLADQAYRLSYWRVAAEEINYRRFFDINDLAAIRVEEPTVMEAVHRKAFELLRAGRVTGLRIDHVDGLLDPEKYLNDLQTPAADAIGGSDGGRPTYVIVEKILTDDEQLPAGWPVQGTTGYEFMNVLNRAFVDPASVRAFQRFYVRLLERPMTFDDRLYEAKKLTLRIAMSSELYVLARKLDKISEQHRWSRDFTMNTLHHALGEVVACFPVYRTYIRVDSTDVSVEDRQNILTAIRAAKRRNGSMSASIFDFISDILLLRDPDGLSSEDRAERREFVLKLQQLTGPVMAKGLEDTAFYQAYPLASLNEVGGRPDQFSVSLEELHQWCRHRRQEWPHSLSATATHDTKRGEDVRARLNVLSELPDEWHNAVRRWQRLNRRHKVTLEEMLVPSLNEEYLIYQTLLATWPLEPLPPDAYAVYVSRICAYVQKALKEAKVHTSWINPNETYERAVDAFVHKLIEEPTGPFIDDLKRMVTLTGPPGLWNALSQLVVKATAPGVPDFYQGTELWDFSLVDPDNRRPVDYVSRRQMLERLRARDGERRALISELVAAPADGAIKMFVMRGALLFRRQHRAIFDEGAYVPLYADGHRRRHVVAFGRARGAEAAITAVGRFYASLSTPARPPIGPDVWGEASLPLGPDLPARPYRDVFTGRIIEPTTTGPPALRLAEVFADLPVAVLEAV